MPMNINELCNNLQSLDAHLADKSYVEGYTFSTSDSALFHKIDATLIASHPNVQRWYNHIKSYSHENSDNKLTETISAKQIDSKSSTATSAGNIDKVR